MNIRTSVCLFLWMAFSLGAFAVTSESSRADAYYHYLLGSMKENARDYAGAIDEYQQALKYDPEASEIFSHLAGLYVQTNRMDQAIADARKAIEKNPDNKEVHRMLGQIFMEKMYLNDNDPQNLQQALKEFQEVRRLDPDDDYASLSLGQLYLQSNQPKAAIDLLTKYLQRNPDSSIAIMSLASAYQKLNQNDKAVSYLLKYLEANPDNIYVTQQIADLYQRDGDYAHALEFQKRAYQSNSDNPAVIQKYVDLLGKNRNYPEAVRILEDQVKKTPDKPEWTILLARTLQKSGDQERAESLIKDVISKHPDDLDFRLALAQMYEESDQFPQAETQLTDLLNRVEADKKLTDEQRKAQQSLIYSHLGFAKHHQKDYEASNEFYKKARDLVDLQDRGKIDFYIALNYRGQKKWDQAIDTLNSILRDNADDTDTWELLSLIYEDKGDPQNSDKVIQHLIDTHPEVPDYYILKAERMQQRQQYAQSLPFLQNLASKFPSNDDIFFLLGSAAERTKKYDEAEDYFKKCISLNPQNANALNYLGYMFIDQGVRIEESIEYVKRALEIDQNNGAYLDSLGWGYFKLNKLDLAEDNLRMALQRLEDNAVVHDHLGDLYFKLGKFQDAIQHWELALKSKSNEIDAPYIQKKIDDTKTRIH